MVGGTGNGCLRACKTPSAHERQAGNKCGGVRWIKPRGRLDTEHPELRHPSTTKVVWGAAGDIVRDQHRLVLGIEEIDIIETITDPGRQKDRLEIGVTWSDGIIVRVQRAAPTPAQKLWIAPALLDLQINGFGGIDFQQDNLTAENLDTAVETLRAAGCTRFLLTLITEEWPRLVARLKYLRALRAQSAELSVAIAGWHIEGPFLSAEPGYCGAHEPALMRDPAPSLIRELRAATGHDPVLLTLAPERSGALEAITLAVSVGMRVSLGHTNASAEVLQRAVKAGASGFTHLGNACPRELDRHDNLIRRASWSV